MIDLFGLGDNVCETHVKCIGDVYLIDWWHLKIFEKKTKTKAIANKFQLTMMVYSELGYTAFLCS